MKHIDHLFETVATIAVIGTIAYLVLTGIKDDFVHVPSVVSYEANSNGVMLYYENGSGYYIEVPEGR